MKSHMSNLLLKPFDRAPFKTIENSHFKPAFKAALEDARKEIAAIVASREKPDFQNTIEALEFSGTQLERLSSLFFNLNSAETNDELQGLAQEISPLLSEFSNDIALNEVLFEKVAAVYAQKDSLPLTDEQQMLLEKKYKYFSRNGAHLPEDKKSRLRAVDKELAQLKLTFGEHVLAETNSFEMHLTREEEIEGLPEGALEEAAQLAASKGKEGWIITLDYPSYIPFMTYAKNRELRKKLAIAFGSKGFHGNSLDNQELVLRIAKLRHERARLLGYTTHAHFVLEERMAETPEKVISFLEELSGKARPAAQRELTELTEFASQKDGIGELQKWDGSYYSEKLKQERFDLDDEKLKPYFKLENVISGVFDIAGELYGLYFKETTDVETYHQDVKTYEVNDENGKNVALLYADFHPRPGKRGGAWMTSYKPQYRKDGVNVRPHIAIVCNFTKPTKTKPSLLTFNEVTTLFHEFGHALHGMLADTSYPSLSGTSVYWDFVELPSQIMENWCFEKEALERFARHYESGEALPMELIEKIKASSNFLEGMATLRQLSFGFLDMAWHGSDPTDVQDVKKLETEAFKNTQLYPDTPETCMSTSFSHIFQGGYSAGYYSYKWAEVLDADAFAYFKERGIFDKEVATRFKKYILSRGGTEKPMELYKKFRGSEPKLDALLERAGLLKKTA
jgi:peptidyl-dipeptidase Dcp